MKTLKLCILSFCVFQLYAQKTSLPIVKDDLIFEDQKGIVVLEAEHFYKQTLTEKRAWYINSPIHNPGVWPDHDTASYADAGGLAYVEALPDLFHLGEDPIINGDNLGSNGSSAVMHYKVFFNKPGRYYIWTRLRSNDDEDNTTQAGINGTWPKTSQILQSPTFQKKWLWKSDNRVSRKPWVIGRASLEVPSVGLHDIQFCLREDGEEFDRFIFTTDSLYSIVDGVGPSETVKSGKLPKAFSLKEIKPIQPLALINPDGSVYGANVFFTDTADVISFEAENFYRQTKTDERMWHLVSTKNTPTVGPDSDPVQLAGSSENCYLELLPDARQKDADGINSKTSISGNPGEKAIISYFVYFNAPGKYYVWTRAFANDGDDNTLHTGVDGTWPESGKKIHFGGKEWKWTNTQRDTKAKVCIDIPTAGVHEVQFSMREDGCQIDRFLLTQKIDYVPSDSITIPTKIKRGDIKVWYDTRNERMSTINKFVADSGFVSIEVESIPSTIGWKYAADKSGMSGFGFLEWGEVGQGIKPGKGILLYTFEITENGNYQFLLRSKMKDPKNRMDTPDADGNDVWVKFAGGTDVKSQKALGNDWFKVAILGHPEGWTWNTNADAGAPHPITPVCRYFEKGIYTLELSGRSQGHIIDKVILTKINKAPITDFEKYDFTLFTAAKESKKVRK